jgi:hypothetical protein
MDWRTRRHPLRSLARHTLKTGPISPTQRRGGESRTESPSASFVSFARSLETAASEHRLTLFVGEKTRENKERAERDARNRDHAGNIYRVAGPDDVPGNDEDDLSGLPWGSVNLKHVISRGHDNESKRSGGGADGLRDDGSQYMGPYSDGYAAPGSRSGSGSGSYSTQQHAPQQNAGDYALGPGVGGVPAYHDDDASVGYDPNASPTRPTYHPSAQ